MLRSYAETSFTIILENTLNQIIKTSGINEFKDKKIIFLRTMEFSDLMSLMEKLRILEFDDIDIVSRMHDFTSQSIHIGRFFDRCVGWYLLFYLKNIRFRSASNKKILKDIVKIYKNKLTIVPISDNLTDYSRFQSASNTPWISEEDQ